MDPITIGLALSRLAPAAMRLFGTVVTSLDDLRRRRWRDDLREAAR